MKKLIGSLILLASLSHAADPGAARPDLFGTPPSQWNYTLALTTVTISTVPGLLGSVLIPATCASPVAIYDSTATTLPTALVSIATVTATAGLSYDFRGLRTTNGLTIGVGAPCTSGAVITYR